MTDVLEYKKNGELQGERYESSSSASPGRDSKHLDSPIL